MNLFTRLLVLVLVLVLVDDDDDDDDDDSAVPAARFNNMFSPELLYIIFEKQQWISYFFLQYHFLGLGRL